MLLSAACETIKAKSSRALRVRTNEMAMRRSTLTPAQCRLLDTCQEIGFGRIECLLIRDRQPQWRPAPRVLRDILLGKDEFPRRELPQRDTMLKSHFLALFRHLDGIGGTAMVSIAVQDGLPIRLTIEQLNEA